MSLDGYIADNQKRFDWILDDATVDFAGLFARVDTYILGRRTYETVLTNGEPPWQPGMRVYVVSRTLPPGERDGVMVSGDDPVALANSLRHETGDGEIWLFGGGQLFAALLGANQSSARCLTGALDGYTFTGSNRDFCMSTTPTLASLIASVHRLSFEPPPVVSQLGWRFHHVGIPTSEPRADELHLPAFGVHIAGFASSPFGVEWMRYAADSPLHPAIKSLPHVAFEVDDLDAALEGQEVISPPGSPSDGVRAAMILVDSAPVELIWFRRNQRSDD